MAGLLAAPVGWLVVGYLGSLAVLFAAAFWSVNALTGEVTTDLQLRQLQDARRDPVYRTIALRTIGIAALVTITDAVLAFPIAFYMAKVAAPRTKAVAGRGGPDAAVVELPRQGLRLADDPFVRRGAQLGAQAPGIHGPGYGDVAVWLVMTYLWLPYMILPIFAGLERIPDSLLAASEDLGARPVDDLPPGDPAARASRRWSPDRSSPSR